ncbi:MAG: hypothetical protein ACRDTQ_10375, partial [Micromonosporaceae bacterium]
MPTSVLLAVLAAAGLLALAPALVRRYDATERLVAERASSEARVLRRRRRRRTVPGRAPVNPPSNFSATTGDARGNGGSTSPDTHGVATARRHGVPKAASAAAPGSASGAADAAPVSSGPRDTGRGASRGAPGARGKVGSRGAVGSRGSTAPGRAGGRPVSAPPYRRDGRGRQMRPAELQTWWRRRRLRVLTTLAVLALAEVTGTVLIGPGFLVGLGLSAFLLCWYVAALRSRAVAERRRKFHRLQAAAQAAAVRAVRRRQIAERQRRIAEA